MKGVSLALKDVRRITLMDRKLIPGRSRSHHPKGQNGLRDLAVLGDGESVRFFRSNPTLSLSVSSPSESRASVSELAPPMLCSRTMSFTARPFRSTRMMLS